MAERVLAILLALMLSWSALATYASSASPAASAHTQDVVPAPADDGQAAQPQAETASDAQALVMQSPDIRGPVAAATGHWPWSSHARPEPFLGGVRRPPKALRVTA